MWVTVGNVSEELGSSCVQKKKTFQQIHLSMCSEPSQHVTGPVLSPPSSVSAGASQCHRDGTLTAEHSSAGFPVLFFHRLGSRKYPSQSQQADMMSRSLLLCP